MSSLPVSAAGASFSEEVARTAIVEAGRRTGVEPGRAELIRLGSNAVFRIDDDVVARVTRPHHTDRAELNRLVGVARWLEGEHLPATRLLDFEQPVYVDGVAVTYWRAIGRDDRYGSARDLGELLHRLHALARPEALDLPSLAPFGRAHRRLDVAPIAEDDRAFLRSRCLELQESYLGLDFVLPTGHVHGDASVGNVLLDRDGTPTLIDLDDFAIGPREWDLVLTALFYERFGWHTEEEYAAFVEAYGVDIMQWPGYPVLADVREFLMMTWIAQRAGESPKLAAEVALRIETLRTGSSRRGWHPY